MILYPHTSAGRSKYVDFPEDIDLIVETLRSVQVYVRLLISVVCVRWYKWMINLLKPSGNFTYHQV
jgi:hypothetical protein